MNDCVAPPPEADRNRVTAGDPWALESAMYELKVIRERRPGTSPRRVVRNAQTIYELFQPRFTRADREEFLVVPLDVKHAILGFHVVSVGSLTASLVHAREVFKVAILANAAALVFVHNHPSGDPTPSSQDIALTKRLVEVGDLVGITVLDHIVMGDNRYVSFVEDGYMPPRTVHGDAS